MKIILFSLILLIYSNSFAQKVPSVRFEDKVRIAEAYRIADRFADSVWTGWSETPFVIMLVDNDYEFLIGHTPTTDDFAPLGYDEILKQEVYYRNRTYDKGLLATFPAVGGIPTVVIGLPENTGLNSAGWTITLLHEHFHQYQMTNPDYFSSVESLNLSNGDQTGMWMLNYPFPYGSQEAGEHLLKVNELLSTLIVDYDEAKYNEYVAGRQKLKEIFGDENYRYYSFQLWQEGLARYTEMKLMEKLNDGYEPTKAFQNLSDYQPMNEIIIYAFKELQQTLKNAKLSEYERVLFYTIGAGEGLLLDKVNPAWKEKYFTEKFYIENYY